MADASGQRVSRRRRRGQRVVPLETVPASRMRWVFFLLCFCLIGLMGRMSWLQVFQASALEARARSVQTQRTDPLGTRRPIVDRAGRLVALDEERFRLW
ncbi:MAG: penicillin-binding protein 2, partial [Synechococcus sp.]|nr:penicillin-binding protein 2 [Synechococcus sp.]